MPIIKCTIDRRAIESATKQQRMLMQKVILVDPSGLRLAVNAKSASWNYNYRKRGLDYYGNRHPQKTLRLGDTVSMTPQEARLRVEELKAEVRNGGDPAAKIKHEAEQALKEAFMHRSLMDWISSYSEWLGTNTKHKKEELMHARYGLNELGILNSPPSSVTGRLLRNITQIHSERPSTGRHRFGAISRFFDYLVDEEALERNPARDVSKHYKPKPPSPRASYYSIEELRMLWTPHETLRSDYLRFLRFMIVCPLRMSEASELIQENIFLEEQQLRLSAKQTKNNEAFTLPLLPIAIETLQPDSFEVSKRCFQLSSKGDSPMRSWSYFRKAIRRTTGIKHFTPHDLRRTFTSLMSEHSTFSESIIDSLLNHKRAATRQGVMRHYQHAKNLKQRREVMEWWSDFLEREVING